jgi:hypothetical protein
VRHGWPGWPAGANEATVCTLPPVAHRFEPQPAQRSALLQRHARFATLYPALRDSFHASSTAG